MSMPRWLRKNRNPEPVRPTLARVPTSSSAPVPDPLTVLARDLQTAKEEAARWKGHSESFAREAEEARAAIARVRAIKKAPARSRFNAFTNAQDDGWDQALDAVHDALADRPLTPVTVESHEAGMVAYRSTGGRLLRCLEHAPPTELIGSCFHPVTSEDLPDGGVCTHPECGVDVLAVPEARSA